MRNVLCQTLVKYSGDPEFVFLTGDLGYNALEPLREAMGPRFINAGVAEQNMLGVAAGLSRMGFRAWTYSIAPFIYGRPFEQIRNDICMHDLPVRIIGNGGGYAYGVMGGTHHALEDYGVLLALPNMHVFAPAFADDVPVIIGKLNEFKHPAYLRLGRCEKPKDSVLPAYAPWRKLLHGKGPTMLIAGPVAGSIWGAVKQLDETIRPALWVLSELPIDISMIPKDFIADLEQSGHLFVIEEHVAQGGLGHIMAHQLLLMGKAPPKFTHRCALGYVSGFYGSQNFHRRECGFAPENIIAELTKKI
ncbi:MAG: transketolase [Planctomycetota bacterium]